jgi:hypothetical protein
MKNEKTITLCLQLNNRRNPYLRKRQSAQEMCSNHQPTRQEILWLPCPVGVRSSGIRQTHRQGERSDGDTDLVKMRGGNPSLSFCFDGLRSTLQTVFLSTGIIHKILLENLCNLPIDFFPKLCYTMNVRRGAGNVREEPPTEDKHTKPPIATISVQSVLHLTTSSKKFEKTS